MYDWNSILFRSGDLFLPKKIRDFLEYYYIGDDTTIFYITNWTIVHYLSGLVIAWYLQRNSQYQIFFYALLIHTLWEIWQIYGKNTKIYTHRGKIDVLVDTSAFLLGVWTYLEINKK